MNAHLQLLLPLLGLGGGVGVPLLVTVDEHPPPLQLLHGGAHLHHIVAPPRLLPQDALLLPQGQLPVDQLLGGPQLSAQLLQRPGA